MNDYDRVASCYAHHQIGGTVLLAYRDLPALITAHVRGSRAIDFGCGSGKSTRFLQDLGFQVTGLDISPAQLEIARAADRCGDYRLIEKGGHQLPVEKVDLAISVFVFLEMERRSDMQAAAKAIHNALAPGGVFFLIGCSEGFYQGDWVTLGVDFPENKSPRSGDPVRVHFLDIDLDIDDYFWTDADYTGILEAAGFHILDRVHPLGHEDDGVAWKDEGHSAPFVIYVAKKAA